MTTAIILTGAIVWSASCLWLGWLLWIAPQGYQDSAGYHAGQQPDAEPVTPRSETSAPGFGNDAGGVFVVPLHKGDE